MRLLSRRGPGFENPKLEARNSKFETITEQAHPWLAVASGEGWRLPPFSLL
jgi:hypothetical protein